MFKVVISLKQTVLCFYKPHGNYKTKIYGTNTKDKVIKVYTTMKKSSHKWREQEEKNKGTKTARKQLQK